MAIPCVSDSNGRQWQSFGGAREVGDHGSYKPAEEVVLDMGLVEEDLESIHGDREDDMAVAGAGEPPYRDEVLAEVEEGERC